jgi:outer membrane protein
MKLRLFIIPAFILFIALFFSGCKNQSDAIDPLAFSPKAHFATWQPYKSDIQMTSKTILPADFSIDKKLTLAEVIDIALINNPTTKITWAQAKYAASKYGESLSPFFPELDGDASYTRERQAFINEHMDTENKLTTYYRTTITPELNLSYTIFDFGQRKNTSDEARYALYYANRTHNRSIETIVKQTMSDYYDLQYQNQKLRSLVSDFENAKTSLDAAETKYKFGLVAIGDITQAKTKYLQVKIDLLIQEKDVNGSFATLSTDMGVPSNIDFKLVDAPEDILVNNMLDSLEKLIEKSFKQRQDLIAAKDNYKSQESAFKYAKVAYYPKLTGAFNFGKNFYNNNLHDDYHFAGVLKVSVPLFKGFYFKNQIHAAKANVYKAKEQLSDKELTIIKEVTTTHFDVKIAAKTYKSSQEYLIEAEKRYDIALESYKAGTMNILDVLAAQSSLADARAKFAYAINGWYSSLANLAYSTGSLCNKEETSKDL